MVDTLTIDPELEDDLKELVSAEDFLDYFEVPYDGPTVRVNRLHILQKFHNLLDETDDIPANPEAWHALYRHCLTQAYETFLDSDAVTEKLFKVFHDVQVPKAPVQTGGFVSADSLLK